MKSIINALLLILFAYTPFTAHSQIISVAKDAVRKAEKKVAEKAVEKTFNAFVDKLFGSDSTSVASDSLAVQDSTKTKSSKGILGGLFSSEPVNKSYDFAINVEVEITTEEKGKAGDPLNMNMLYPKEGSHIGIELESAMIISDYNDMKHYTVAGGNVSVMDLNTVLEKAAKYNEKSDDDKSNMKVEKTGKTKKIAGYLCHQYTMVDDETKGEWWITEDLDVNMDIYAKSFEANPNIIYPKEFKGIALEMYINYKDKSQNVKYITKSVTKSEISYDLSKYKVVNLSAFKY